MFKVRIKGLLDDLITVVRYHFRPGGDEGARTAIRLMQMYQRARQLEQLGIEEPDRTVYRPLDEYDLIYM